MTFIEDFKQVGQEIADNINEHRTGNLVFGDTTVSGNSGLGDLADAVDDLVGDKDIFIKIIPSSQYVVAEESFVLSVLLTNGLGEPLSNKSVTVEGSDGSEYYGITNNQGIAAFVIFIDEDTSFTATYEDLTATVDNVISATGGGSGGASVTGETLLLSSATVVGEELIL